MKIIKIEINPKIDKTLVLGSGVELFAVIITYKKWFITKKMNAYPTNYGPTFGSGKIRYFYYVDDLGKEIEYNISEQINNWCLMQRLTK